MDNYYELLGIKETSGEADEKAVARAYRKVALKYHPDKLKDK